MSPEEGPQNNSERALNEAVDRLASIFVQFLDDIKTKKEEDCRFLSKKIKNNK